MICENFAYPILMKYFEEISAIPRPSYHEERIADYLESFAAKRGLVCYRDAVGNVLINAPATEGHEKKAPVLLQGHTDMVCEKNAGVDHDFMKDPLEIYEENGMLRARGTTLGADNGVAVAVMLAILDGGIPHHPPLQCLFTVSEEVGMDGAKAFDYSRIFARRMLNLDAADESTIIVGCTGGIRSSLHVPLQRENSDTPRLTVSVLGLAGGHSGEDIHKGRANANRLLGQILAQARSVDGSLRILSIKGGSKDNAIPREAEVTITVSEPQRVTDTILAYAEAIRGALCSDDGRFSVTVQAENNSLPFDVYDEKGTSNIIFLLTNIATGVLATDPKHADMVAYSRNLAVIRGEKDSVELVLSSRSAKDAQLDASIEELDRYAEQVGGRAKHYNRYPGWNEDEASAIREAYRRAYTKLFEKEPKEEVIHAGLECGVIKASIPNMDMLACGPIVRDLHSPDETLDLRSFERFFALLIEILQA